ncbi:MAG: hypothetical protein Q9217_002188 [Psora testacea]
MTDPNRHTDVLLTDHFTYTPLSLVDDIINAVNTIVYQALDALEDGLLAVVPAQLGFRSPLTSAQDSSAPANEDGSSDAADAAKDEIENGVHQLETLLESTVDKSFDKFEIYTLRNILTVPDDLTKWIRLGHYEGMQLPLPETAATPESVLLLRRKVQETRKLNQALKSKHTKNTALISQLHKVLSTSSIQTSSTANATIQSNSLAFITQATMTSSTSQTPLTTSSEFVTSQVPALRQLVADLRLKLPLLQDISIDNIEWESKREERRQYIENGVRRVVDGGGFDGGVGEGMMDSLASMGAERRRREEVEGLEGIVKEIGMGVMGN